jgi:hypothetical protein
MEQNLAWLFWAYGIGWALILIYLVRISRREQALQRRLAWLQALVESQSAPHPAQNPVRPVQSSEGDQSG